MDLHVNWKGVYKQPYPGNFDIGNQLCQMQQKLLLLFPAWLYWDFCEHPWVTPAVIIMFYSDTVARKLNMTMLVWLSNANPDISFPVHFLSLPGLLAVLSQISTYFTEDPRRLVDLLLQLQCSELCLLLSTHNCFSKSARKLPYFFLLLSAYAGSASSTICIFLSNIL